MSTHDLHAAWSALDARRARSRQRKLGPSAIGSCRRRIAYVLAGTPKSDDVQVGMAALLGTAVHKGALHALGRMYGALTEVRVESSNLRGSADAVYMDDLIVEDVKTTGYWGFEYSLNRGVTMPHLYQVHLYAWHLREGLYSERTGARLGHRTSLPIERIRVRYVSRDNGDEWMHEAPYSERVTTLALMWLTELMDRVEHDGPEEVPRDEPGPELSYVCDTCPWLTRCWGPERDDGAMRQANIVHDDDQVAAALESYVNGRTMAKDGAAAMEAARALVTGSAPGVYGDLQLGWTPRKGTNRVDLDAVRELYAEAGLDVPVTTSPAGRSIRVGPAKPVKKGEASATPIEP